VEREMGVQGRAATLFSERLARSIAVFRSECLGHRNAEACQVHPIHLTNKRAEAKAMLEVILHPPAEA
jgi:hypothetical protein